MAENQLPTTQTVNTPNPQRKAKFRELYGTSKDIAQDVYRHGEPGKMAHNRRILAAKIAREFIGQEKNHGAELKAARDTSMLDTLTGVKSRRWFDEEIERQTAHATRTGSPLYMMIIDLDKFKLINDGLGHPAGDLVLKLAGKLETRTDEPLTRYGGDEFCQFIAREMTQEDLATMTNRYRNQISEESSGVLKDIPTLPESEIKNPLRVATVSFGVTKYIPGETAENFRMRADTALYHVKSNGRDSGAIAVPDSTGTGITFIDIPKN